MAAFEKGKQSSSKGGHGALEVLFEHPDRGAGGVLICPDRHQVPSLKDQFHRAAVLYSAMGSVASRPRMVTAQDRPAGSSHPADNPTSPHHRLCCSAMGVVTPGLTSIVQNKSSWLNPVLVNASSQQS
jgi:hypothetical protein